MTQKKHKSNYFRGDVWFDKKVDAHTRAALQEKEAEFKQTHKYATDEQLLDYVRAFAEKHGYTPNCDEIIGGAFIARRWGDWMAVVTAAGLPKPSGKSPIMKKRDIYKQEFKRQARLFQQERREQKRQKVERTTVICEDNNDERKEIDADGSECCRKESD